MLSVDELGSRRCSFSAITSKMTQLYLGGHFHSMCTNQKYVNNPYTGQRFLVKCGKCPSCLQEKADRLTSRLNNHSTDYNRCAIFSTLTYKEEFVPYVLKQDLENANVYELPVYRDYIVRRFRGCDVVRRLSGYLPISKISLVNEDTGQVNRENVFFHGNLWKKGRGFHPYKMGIIYYKDLQDFKKRLRTNLFRELGQQSCNLEIFATSEYGETHYRPHFHVLVYCDTSQVDRVKSCILQSWRYADDDDVRRSTQVGINPAAYVSSYINSPTGLPDCFTAVSKVKHSFSPTIGKLAHPFSLSQILEKTNLGTLSYSKQTVVNGVPTVFDVPIPKYIINGFFPLFKGLCRCSVDTLDCLLRQPVPYFKYHKCDALTNYTVRSRKGKVVDDTHTNLVRIQNAIDRYCKLTGNHPFDFAIDYQRVWNCYKNTIYKLSFKQDVPMLERYDNINQLIQGHVRNDTLTHYLNDDTITDFNSFKSTKERTERMSYKYFAKTKISKENNYIRVVHLNKNL